MSQDLQNGEYSDFGIPSSSSIWNYSAQKKFPQLLGMPGQHTVESVEESRENAVAFTIDFLSQVSVLSSLPMLSNAVASLGKLI